MSNNVVVKQEKRLVIGISPFDAYKKTITPDKFYKATFHEEFPVAQPGMISYNDKQSISAIDTLQEVITAERIKNVLTAACRFKPSDRLDFSMRIRGTRKAQKQVEEYQEADITKTPPHRVDFRLKKNMDHIAASDESQMTNETIMNLMDNILDTSAALATAKDELIADALLSGTQHRTAIASWENNATNPYKDFNAALKQIRKNQCGYADVLIANSDVWGAFFALDKVNGVLKGIEPHLEQSSFTVPILPGKLCLCTDVDAFEEDIMVIANKQLYCVLGQGPHTIEEYRAATSSYDGYLVREYMQAKLAIDKAGIILKDLLA